MDYYPAIKKKEILPFVTTRMDLGDTMLSEINRTEKDQWRSHLYGEPKKSKLIDTENRFAVARSKGGGVGMEKNG